MQQHNIREKCTSTRPNANKETRTLTQIKGFHGDNPVTSGINTLVQNVAFHIKKIDSALK